MVIFRDEKEIKRMIFNVDGHVAYELEILKSEARNFGKKLDVDSFISKELAKFNKKARKRMDEMAKEAYKDTKKTAKGKKEPLSGRSLTISTGSEKPRESEEEQGHQ